MKKQDLRILIVEDDAIITMYIESVLSKQGLQIVGNARSVDEALERIEATSPNFLLIDVSLEGQLNGIDLAEIITKENNIPFIFMTGNNDMLVNNPRITPISPSAILSKPTSEKMLASTFAKLFPE